MSCCRPRPNDFAHACAADNYIPQFYFSELPPTTITTQAIRDASLETGWTLDEATADLISNRDKGVMKEVVRRHLATTETAAPARPDFNPSA